MFCLKKTCKSALLCVIVASISALVWSGCGSKAKPDEKATTPAAAAAPAPTKDSKVLEMMDEIYLVGIQHGTKRAKAQFRSVGGAGPTPLQQFARIWSDDVREQAWQDFKELSAGKNAREAELGAFGKAAIYAEWNMPGKCREEVNKLKAGAGADSPLVRYVEGLLAANQGNYKEAVGNYSQILRKNPGVVFVTVALARTYSEMGDNAMALNTYKQAAEAKPEVYLFHREIGEMEKKLGNNDAALKAFQKAIELNPKDDETQLKLAQLKEETGDISGAIENYEKAAAIRGQSVEILQKLIELNAKIGNTEGEMNTLTRHLELTPRKVELHVRLGNLALKAGQQARAHKAAEEALKIKPDDAKAQLLMARTLRKEKDLKNALKYYIKTLSNDPSFKEAKEEYDELKGKFHIGEPITADTPQAVFDKMAKKVEEIYRKRLEDSPKLKGALQIELKIDKDGSVKNIEMVENSLNDELLELSIYGMALEAKFPPSKSGMTVTFPFNFSH